MSRAAAMSAASAEARSRQSRACPSPRHAFDAIASGSASSASPDGIEIAVERSRRTPAPASDGALLERRLRLVARRSSTLISLMPAATSACSPASSTSRSAHSLKEKRHHLRSAKAQLQNRVGASVAEVDHHDVWQRARITVACVAREHMSSSGCSTTPSAGSRPGVGGRARAALRRRSGRLEARRRLEGSSAVPLTSRITPIARRSARRTRRPVRAGAEERAGNRAAAPTRAASSRPRPAGARRGRRPDERCRRRGSSRSRGPAPRRPSG